MKMRAIRNVKILFLSGRFCIATNEMSVTIMRNVELFNGKLLSLKAIFYVGIG